MKSKPKIVYWDLETLPDPRQIYKNIPTIGAWPGRTFKAELQTILTYGYMIEGQDKPSSLSSYDLSDDPTDDSYLVQFAWDLMHDADLIVTHNGKQFDLKVLNTRLLYWGFPPLPKIKHVDTKQILKTNLSLYSNSLDSAAKYLGLQQEKMHWSNKWGTWERIAFGEATKEDYKIMSVYCEQDVAVLRELYKSVHPFLGNKTVNHNIYSERLVCPTCGSENTHKHGSRFRKSLAKTVQRRMCQACGSVFETELDDSKPRGL